MGEGTRAARAVLARNALHLVAGQVLTTLLAIVFSAALGRRLGAADFGLYFLVTSFSTFAYVVVEWGQRFYIIRELAQSPQRGGELLGTALALRAAGALAICIPAGLVSLALGYDARTCWYSVAFVLANLPFGVTQGYGLFFRARDRMGLDAIVSVVNKAVSVGVALVALALGTGLVGVLVALALAGLISFSVATALYRRAGAAPMRFSTQAAWEVLVGGAAIVTMTIAVSVQPYLDAILLSKLARGDAVGWFGAAKNIMGTLLAPSLIIGAAAYPRLSRVAKDPAAFGADVRATLRPMLFLGALAALGTYLFADDAIALVYGQRHFGPAGIILQVFAPGLFLMFVDVLFANALSAIGRSSAFSMVKVVSVALNTALDLLLIPYFQRRTGDGGIGVVAAFGISEIVVFAGAASIMPRSTLSRGMWADVVRALSSALGAGLLFRELPHLPLAVAIPSCVVAFTLCALACGLVRKSDVALARALLRRKGAPVRAESSESAAPAA